MNEAHFHLVANHFPIIGLIIGSLVLMAGYTLSKSDVRNTGLYILLISALAAVIAYVSGQRAEYIVESLPGINHDQIENHEINAIRFMINLLFIGVLSLFGLIIGRKDLSWKRYMYVLLLLAIIIGFWQSWKVGITGGGIRHTEINHSDR